MHQCHSLIKTKASPTLNNSYHHRILNKSDSQKACSKKRDLSDHVEARNDTHARVCECVCVRLTVYVFACV